MSQSVWLTLGIIYAASIFIYTIYSLVKKTKLVLLPVFIFLPFIGPVALVIIALGSAMSKEKEVDVFEQDGEEKRKYEYLTQINDEKEMNIVPMKEAMALNKTSTQRDIVFELAKGDPSEFIKNLKSALLSEDSEVAHYAASSIAKYKRGLDKTIGERQTLYEQHPEQEKNRTALIQALNEAIEAELGPREETQGLINRIIDVLMMEIKLGDAIPKERYLMICSYILRVGDFDNFKVWIAEFQKRFPEADEPLRLKLQYAYHAKDREMFDQVFEEAKTAKYAITKETLGMLEFWSEGNKQ